MVHGCTICNPRDLAHPFHKGLTMLEVFDKTVNRSIEYVDSRSMYPRVLRDSKFPKGHPVLKHCSSKKTLLRIQIGVGPLRWGPKT